MGYMLSNSKAEKHFFNFPLQPMRAAKKTLVYWYSYLMLITLFIQAIGFTVFAFLMIFSFFGQTGHHQSTYPSGNIAGITGVVILVLLLAGTFGYLAYQCYRMRKYNFGLCMTLEILLFPVGISLYQAQHKILAVFLCSTVVIAFIGLGLRAVLVADEIRENHSVDHNGKHNGKQY